MFGGQRPPKPMTLGKQRACGSSGRGGVGRKGDGAAKALPGEAVGKAGAGACAAWGRPKAGQRRSPKGPGRRGGPQGAPCKAYARLNSAVLKKKANQQ